MSVVPRVKRYHELKWGAAGSAKITFCTGTTVRQVASDGGTASFTSLVRSVNLYMKITICLIIYSVYLVLVVDFHSCFVAETRVNRRDFHKEDRR